MQKWMSVLHNIHLNLCSSWRFFYKSLTKIHCPKRYSFYYIKCVHFMTGVHFTTFPSYSAITIFKTIKLFYCTFWKSVISIGNNFIAKEWWVSGSLKRPYELTSSVLKALLTFIVTSIRLCKDRLNVILVGNKFNKELSSNSHVKTTRPTNSSYFSK